MSEDLMTNERFESTLHAFLTAEARRAAEAAPPVELVLRRLEEVTGRGTPAPPAAERARGGIRALVDALPAPVRLMVVIVITLTALGLGIGLAGIGSRPATPSPAVSPTPDVTATVDALIASWNGGDGSGAAAQYEQNAHVFFVIDSGDITETYAAPDQIAGAVSRRARHGFVITRTGPPQARGALAAFPVRWFSADTYGLGDGVVVLELTPAHRVLAQFVIGVSSAAPAERAGPAEPDLVERVNAVVAATMEQRVTAADVRSLFASDAEWRAASGVPGVGWSSFVSPPAIGLDAITNLVLSEQGLSVVPTGDAVQQGPLVIYPSTFSAPAGAGTSFWILRSGADGLIHDYWELDAWQ